MLYKKNSRQVVERLTQLYHRQARDRIFAAFDIPSTPFGEALSSLADGECGYPDLGDRIAFWDKALRERSCLEDDSIPICYCSELDQGLVSGLFGAQGVVFMTDSKTGWISSMSAPFAKNLNDLPALDREGLWAGRMEAQFRTFAQAARGKYAVAPVCTIEGLNFLCELCGATDAYLDIADGADILNDWFALSIEAARFINDSYFNIAGLLCGGTPGYAWQWAPGRTIMDSVDAFHMTSEEDFERWGRPWFEALASHYDGSHVHIHANAYRMIPYVSTLKGLMSIHLGDDPYNPKAMERVSEFDTQRGAMPLIVAANVEEFARRLQARDLPGNVLYLVNGLQTAREANDMMRAVREYRTS